MIEVSNTILLLSVFVLLLMQAVGAQLAALESSPRAYFIMSSTVGLLLAYAVLVYGPQVI